MIKVGVGASRHHSTEQAAAEAATRAMQQASVGQADVVLVFATVSHAPRYSLMLKTLAKITKTEQILGCSGLGTLTLEGEIEAAPGVAVMVLSSDSIRVTPFIFQNLSDRNEAIGQELGRLAASNRGSSQDSVLVLLFPDAFFFQPQPFFQGFQSTAGFIPIIGGAASEDGTQMRTFQMYGEQADSNALTGVILAGQFQYTHSLAQACQPIGPSLLVTRARRKIILELGGRPALGVFMDLLRELEIEDIQMAAGRIFLALPVDPSQAQLTGGDYLVRNIVGIDPKNGSLHVAEDIAEGQAVAFTLREPLRAKQGTEEIVTDMARIHQGVTPKAGFYFNCCGRGTSLYGEKDVDVTILQRAFPDLPLIGFFTYAELAPIQTTNLFHNYTGVLTLISER
jgi:small ligand-binding sensory domain FIST